MHEAAADNVIIGFVGRNSMDGHGAFSLWSPVSDN